LWYTYSHNIQEIIKMKNRSKLSIEKQKCIAYIETTGELFLYSLVDLPLLAKACFFFSFNYEEKNSQKKLNGMDFFSVGLFLLFCSVLGVTHIICDYVWLCCYCDTNIDMYFRDKISYLIVDDWINAVGKR